MSNFVLNSATKKHLFEIYNDINRSLYGFGTSESKIFVVDNMIIFSAQHNRVPCLMALEEKYLTLKESVDAALMKVFKDRLSRRLEEALQLRPKAVLRDYAFDSLIAITVVVLESE